MTLRARGLARNMCQGAQIGTESHARTTGVSHPFLVDRLRRAAGGGDRRAAELEPAVASLGAEQRELLTEAWLADARSKHASRTSLARLSMQLLGLGAPPDLVRAAQHASLDEVEHAELCFGLAIAYAGRQLEAPEGPQPEPRAASPSLSAIASRAIAEGCIGATQSAMIALGSAEHCTDPCVARVWRRIAADETRHAGLAWRFVQWALSRDPSLAEMIRDAFDRACAALPPAPPEALPPVGWLERHGRLSAPARQAIAVHTLHEVVAPCAHAVLAKLDVAVRGAERCV